MILILYVLSPSGCQEEGVQCCSCTSRRVCKLNKDLRTCYFTEVSGLLIHLFRKEKCLTKSLFQSDKLEKLSGIQLYILSVFTLTEG